MKKYLNPEYDCIFVILGKGCNMRCKYCLQAPYDRQEAPTKDLPLVADFIRDAAENQKSPLTVQFFGGEPLMYLKDLKKLVRVLKDIPNIRFSFISNGTLITPELVEYFNEHNFYCAVSWDGPRSTEIRGLDIFTTNGENIMKLKNLGISAITSAYCYPKDLIDAYAKLNDKYYSIHGSPLNFSIEEFLDTGMENVNELLANKDVLRSQMAELVNHYRLAVEGKTHNEHYARYIEQHIRVVQSSISKDVMIGTFTRCGDGTRVVNVDLQGNLYKCHNHEVQIGTVQGGFWDVLNKSILADNAIPHRKECTDCYVAPLCLGGCALIEDRARQGMCELHMAFYAPIIDFVMEQVK